MKDETTYSTYALNHSMLMCLYFSCSLTEPLSPPAPLCPPLTAAPQFPASTASSGPRQQEGPPAYARNAMAAVAAAAAQRWQEQQEHQGQLHRRQQKHQPGDQAAHRGSAPQHYQPQQQRGMSARDLLQVLWACGRMGVADPDGELVAAAQVRSPLSAGHVPLPLPCPPHALRRSPARELGARACVPVALTRGRHDLTQHTETHRLTMAQTLPRPPSAVGTCPTVPPTLPRRPWRSATAPPWTPGPWPPAWQAWPPWTHTTCGPSTRCAEGRSSCCRPLHSALHLQRPLQRPMLRLVASPAPTPTSSWFRSNSSSMVLTMTAVPLTQLRWQAALQTEG